MSATTGSIREIKTTFFDPASVFLSTHWWASNPASELLPNETCTLYNIAPFHRFSAHPASEVLKHIARNGPNSRLFFCLLDSPCKKQQDYHYARIWFATTYCNQTGGSHVMLAFMTITRNAKVNFRHHPANDRRRQKTGTGWEYCVVAWYFIDWQRVGDCFTKWVECALHADAIAVLRYVPVRVKTDQTRLSKIISCDPCGVKQSGVDSPSSPQYVPASRLRCTNWYSVGGLTWCPNAWKCWWCTAWKWNGPLLRLTRVSVNFPRLKDRHHPCHARQRGLKW